MGLHLVFVKFDGGDDAGVVEHVRRVAQRGQRPQVAVARELAQAVGKVVQAGKIWIVIVVGVWSCKEKFLTMREQWPC